ncbi:MAG: peroxiredoxin [Candidatus Poseidoniaceae archaeon]|jgi:peroxiredoxin (alkyl hydroperoxide reductase subunit C)|nr:peroxiredoxin [Candidatus Poseidoniaceae archaeon]
MDNMINKLAPKWSATVYNNGAKEVMNSEDMEGGWYLIYWYPLDFTFICPTEIVGFEELKEDFEDDAVTVIGCSTDSYFSHKAWFADGDIFPGGVTHPVIADTTHSITRAFGMMNDAMGVGFRGTVLVDPEGKIQMYSINGMDAGRSPVEILRTVQATQAGGLCGANWKKGDSFAA